MRVFDCNLSQAFHNKTGDKRLMGTSFKPAHVTIDDLYRHIRAGYAFTPAAFRGNSRKDATFKSAALVALDYDDNVSCAAALQVPFVAQYAAIVYPTHSSCRKTENNPHAHYRTRVVFVLSEPVPAEYREGYRELIKAIAAEIGLPADDNSAKPAQPAFGSTNDSEPAYLNAEAVLPLQVAGALTRHAAEQEDQERERKKKEPPTPPAKPVPAAESHHYASYANTTFQNAIADLAATPPGTRNNNLFKIAARLFGFAKAGNWHGIDEPTVQRELESVVAQWDDLDKSLGTIQNARNRATPRYLELADKQDFTAHTAPPPAPAEPPITWRHPLPDSWRTLLLTYAPRAALLFELVNRATIAALVNPASLTFAELERAASILGFAIQPRTLRGLLTTARNMEFVQELPTVPHTRSTTDNPNDNTVGKSCTNSQRGRKATTYRACEPADVCQVLLATAARRIYERHHTPAGDAAAIAGDWQGMLRDTQAVDADTAAKIAGDILDELADAGVTAGTRAWLARREYAALVASLENHHHTPLPDGWQVGTLTQYRAAFLRALNARNNTMSYRQIAAKIGTTQRTVSSTIKNAGLKNKSRFERVPITAGSIAEQVHAAAKQLKGKPLYVVAIDADGISHKWLYSEPQAQAALERYQHVFIELQITSEQQVISATQPARKPRKLRSSASARTTTTHRQQPPIGRYDPVWVAEQIRLALHVLGWHADDTGALINPSGELIRADNTGALWDLLVGYVRRANHTAGSTAAFADFMAGELREAGAHVA